MGTTHGNVIGSFTANNGTKLTYAWKIHKMLKAQTKTIKQKTLSNSNDKQQYNNLTKHLINPASDTSIWPIQLVHYVGWSKYSVSWSTVSSRINKMEQTVMNRNKILCSDFILHLIQYCVVLNEHVSLHLASHRTSGVSMKLTNQLCCRGIFCFIDCIFQSTHNNNCDSSLKAKES